MPELEIADQNFDLSFLMEIADGSDEFLVESIELFLKQTPELMLAINNAINAQDWTLVAQSAHKLKPNLGFFGMLTGQTLMQELEAIAKTTKDTDAVKAKYSELQTIVEPTLVKLEVIKNVKAAAL